MRHALAEWVVEMHARHCSRIRLMTARVLIWAGLSIAWIMVVLR